MFHKLSCLVLWQTVETTVLVQHFITILRVTVTFLRNITEYYIVVANLLYSLKNCLANSFSCNYLIECFCQPAFC